MVKLVSFLLRHYPPGLTLKYERRYGKFFFFFFFFVPTKSEKKEMFFFSQKQQNTSNGSVEQKTIDLLSLEPSTNLDELARKVIDEEPLGLLVNRFDQVKKLLASLQEKTTCEKRVFYLFKMLRAHILPLTNCAFNKDGDKFITGSYDRTCKVWDTATGDELVSLEGHKNVVYALSFNTPFGGMVATGSFDKTCKVCLTFMIFYKRKSK